MKKVTNSLMTTLALALSITACKKENISPNSDFTVNETQSAAGGMIAQKTYSLAKRGNDSVFYDNSNRLSKVQRATDVTLYSYSPNTINAKTFTGRQLTKEVVYTLDANGKAIQSKHTTHSGGGLAIMQTWMYEYDAKGKLKKRYNQLSPSERTEYKYDSTNSLERIIWYNANEPEKIQKQYLPKYKIANTDAFLADKLKLNPHFSELDLYLKIFGTFSKYLPVHVKYQENFVINHEYLKYKFNGDGYPTSHDETYMGEFVKTVQYGYYPTR